MYTIALYRTDCARDLDLLDIENAILRTFSRRCRCSDFVLSLGIVLPFIDHASDKVHFFSRPIRLVVVFPDILAMLTRFLFLISMVCMLLLFSEICWRAQELKCIFSMRLEENGRDCAYQSYWLTTCVIFNEYLEMKIKR